ncbi:MAG: hypothetical protein M3Y40_08340 [Chloroflexota bacterium]|nr:hypothetical protein [Chloroflexota bacterium]
MRWALLLSLLLTVLAACASEPPAEPPPPSAPPPTDAPSESPAPSSSGLDPQPIPHTLAAALNEELRDELLARMAEDQAVRTGIAPPGDDRTPEELFGQMDSVDRQNTTRMHEILEEHGWPGWSLVGEEGSTAAWVLVQHADLEPEFQELALAHLMGAVAAQDASRGDLAYLIDRVRVAKGLPQVYGTQVGPGPDGDLAPRTPIEDPENVDARRAEAGLGTLEEYYDEIREAFGTPEPSASP